MYFLLDFYRIKLLSGLSLGAVVHLRTSAKTCTFYWLEVQVLFTFLIIPVTNCWMNGWIDGWLDKWLND